VGRLRNSLAITSACTLAAGGYMYAAMWPDSQLFGRTLLAGTDPSTIVLTFDDGPNPGLTEPLLDVLAERGVRATFFLIGAFVRQHTGLVRRIYAEGHSIGNHTMHHPRLMWSSPARVREELTACTAAIEDATGEQVRFLRPPHGARRPDVLRMARELGLTPVLWNATGHDWRASLTPAEIFSHCRAGIERNQRRRRGTNLLLHDGGPDALTRGEAATDRRRTLAAVPLLLDHARAQGLRFQTVAQLALQ
jgi:peptidoglycan/xylan/chitin deacetylase (PgdA/CDA1 family)